MATFHPSPLRDVPGLEPGPSHPCAAFPYRLREPSSAKPVVDLPRIALREPSARERHSTRETHGGSLSVRAWHLAHVAPFLCCHTGNGPRKFEFTATRVCIPDHAPPHPSVRLCRNGFPRNAGNGRTTGRRAPRVTTYVPVSTMNLIGARYVVLKDQCTAIHGGNARVASGCFRLHRTRVLSAHEHRYRVRLKRALDVLRSGGPEPKPPPPRRR